MSPQNKITLFVIVFVVIVMTIGIIWAKKKGQEPVKKKKNVENV